MLMMRDPEEIKEVLLDSVVGWKTVHVSHVQRGVRQTLQLTAHVDDRRALDYVARSYRAHISPTTEAAHFNPPDGRYKIDIARFLADCYSHCIDVKFDSRRGP